MYVTALDQKMFDRSFDTVSRLKQEMEGLNHLFPMFTSLVFISTYILDHIRIIRDILIQYQWYQKTSSARIKSLRAPLHLLEGTASTSPVFACRQPQASAFGMSPKHAFPKTIKNIQKKHHETPLQLISMPLRFILNRFEICC
jgi:hypothetical protein